MGGRLDTGRVRPLPRDRKRSDLAGWAETGYCASHARFFWGLRLHLPCTLSGLPVAFALTGAKADERDTLLAMFDADPALMARHRDQVLIADKNYYGTALKPTSPPPGSSCYDQPAKVRNPVRDNASSSRYGRSSSRSTTPSRPSSTWNTTAGAPSPESHHPSCNASSPSPPRSGTTTRPANRSCDH